MVLACLAGCEAVDGRPMPPAGPVGRIELSDTLRLDDGAASILAAPRWAQLGSSGTLLVADRSDRDIKLYDRDGNRIATVGRAGPGPGEFASLMSAEFLADSIVAYDFANGVLTVFDPTGGVGRTLRFREPPWRVKAVADSLLLAIYHPAREGSLISLLRADGEVVTSFFELPRDVARQAQVRANSAVWADAFGDLIVAGLFGDDRVVAFTVDGEPIDTLYLPVPRFAQVAEEHEGALRAADGAWHTDGMAALMTLVALRNGTVAFQIADYDTTHGTDLLEGGLIGIARITSDGLRLVAQDTVSMGLLGRTVDGVGLVMGYTAAVAGRYQVARLRSGTPGSVP